MSSQLAAAPSVTAMLGRAVWAQETGSCQACFQVGSHPLKAALELKQVGLAIGHLRQKRRGDGEAQGELQRNW